MRKIGIVLSLLLILFFLISCEKEDFQKMQEETDKYQTVSIEEAKEATSFLLETTKGKNAPTISFDWNSYSQEEILNSEAKMTVVPIKITNDSCFSRALFIKENGCLKKMIVTTSLSSEILSSNVESLKGRIYLRDFRGVFMYGYEIKNNRIIGMLHAKEYPKTKSFNNFEIPLVRADIILPDVVVITAPLSHPFPTSYMPVLFYEDYLMEPNFINTPEYQYALWNYYKGQHGSGGTGGGNSDKINNETKPKNDLPKKKPTKIISDCNSKLIAVKQNMQNNYTDFSSYAGNKNFNRPSFQDYINTVKADPTHEHSIGINDNGGELLSTKIISQNGTNSVDLSYNAHTIANMHNHPGNLPPSPRDILTTLELANELDKYDALYTLLPDGTVYAFKVTDRNKARSFMKKYEPLITVDSNNRFTPNSTFDKVWTSAEFKFNKLGVTTAWEYTIAYLFEKYNMGLTLLKKDANSNNFKAQYVRKGSNGRYELVECK